MTIEKIREKIMYEKMPDGKSYPKIQITNLNVRKQVGEYGKAVLDYLEENKPERYQYLMMYTKLLPFLQEIELEATRKQMNLEAVLEKNYSRPASHDPLIVTKHLNWIRTSAKETVMNDFILQPR
ncbi:TnpV protein [Listeria monocytogenes]|nr:TnpV protein [Listeria monocytogenes]